MGQRREDDEFKFKACSQSRSLSRTLEMEEATVVEPNAELSEIEAQARLDAVRVLSNIVMKVLFEVVLAAPAPHGAGEGLETLRLDPALAIRRGSRRGRSRSPVP